MFLLKCLHTHDAAIGNRIHKVHHYLQLVYHMKHMNSVSPLSISGSFVFFFGGVPPTGLLRLGMK